MANWIFVGNDTLVVRFSLSIFHYADKLKFIMLTCKLKTAGNKSLPSGNIQDRFDLSSKRFGGYYHESELRWPVWFENRPYKTCFFIVSAVIGCHAGHGYIISAPRIGTHRHLSVELRTHTVCRHGNVSVRCIPKPRRLLRQRYAVQVFRKA